MRGVSFNVCTVAHTKLKYARSFSLVFATAFSYGDIATCWSNSSIYISLSLRTISFKKI